MCNATKPKTLIVCSFQHKYVKLPFLPLILLLKTIFDWSLTPNIQLRLPSSTFLSSTHLLPSAHLFSRRHPQSSEPPNQRRFGYVSLQSEWMSERGSGSQSKPRALIRRKEGGRGGGGCSRWGGGCWEAKLIHCDRNQSCQDHHDQAAWTAYIQSTQQLRGSGDVGAQEESRGCASTRHWEEESVCLCVCLCMCEYLHLHMQQPSTQSHKNRNNNVKRHTGKRTTSERERFSTKTPSNFTETWETGGRDSSDSKFTKTRVFTRMTSTQNHTNTHIHTQIHTHTKQ